MNKVQNTKRDENDDIIVSHRKIASAVLPFAYNEEEREPTFDDVRMAIYNYANIYGLFPGNIMKSPADKRRQGETRLSLENAKSIVTEMSRPESNRVTYLLKEGPIEAITKLYEKEEITFIQVTEARSKITVTPAPNNNPPAETVHPLLVKFNTALLKSHHHLREKVKAGLVSTHTVQALLNGLNADLGEISGDLPQ